jgi:hypothetical protein
LAQRIGVGKQGGSFQLEEMIKAARWFSVGQKRKSEQ